MNEADGSRLRMDARLLLVFTRASDRIGSLGRYTLVSLIALVADTGLYLKLAQPLTPVIASIVGYSFGLVVHYLLSSSFVFPDRTGNRRHARVFTAFAATGGLGIAVTALVVYFLTATFGAPLLVAKAFAVPAVFIAIYVLRRTLVFR